MINLRKFIVWFYFHVVRSCFRTVLRMSLENCIANYYHDREKLVEKLFLESCLPEMKKLVNKVILKTCWGCKFLQPNQLTHSCLRAHEKIHITLSQVEQAAPFMINKTDKVMKEMHVLVSAKPEYSDINLEEFLEFFSPKYELYPLIRLASDSIWLNRIKHALKYEKMDSNTIDPDINAIEI